MASNLQIFYLGIFQDSHSQSRNSTWKTFWKSLVSNLLRNVQTWVRKSRTGTSLQKEEKKRIEGYATSRISLPLTFEIFLVPVNTPAQQLKVFRVRKVRTSTWSWSRSSFGTSIGIKTKEPSLYFCQVRIKSNGCSWFGYRD